jgi:hypothetical protein
VKGGPEGGQDKSKLSSPRSQGYTDLIFRLAACGLPTMFFLLLLYLVPSRCSWKAKWAVDILYMCADLAKGPSSRWLHLKELGSE